MELKNIIGIDMAKDNFELVLLQDGEKVMQEQVVNQVKHIKAFFKKQKIDFSECLFCLEHTGIYNNHLLYFLHEQKANVWLESPVHIKRSLGLTRGKNDRIDAERIAAYALRHQQDAKLWTPRRDVIESLKLLTGQRSRLLKAKKALEIPLKETKSFCSKEHFKLMRTNCKATVKSIVNDVRLIDLLIKNLINADERLKELFGYITSVPYVGLVVGTAILVSTNEFNSITDPRKFACHCGVAPFEHSSGTSIRGKTRVSHMANKELKTLLHLSALGTTSKPGELRSYFERKIGQGKNKMAVLNAIRNKLIHRVFACVRDKKFYQKNLELA